MGKYEITQELVRSHYEYKDGLLYDVGTREVFGRVHSQGYRVGRFHIGYYATELEAAIAYDKAVEHLHGKYQVKNV